MGLIQFIMLLNAVLAPVVEPPPEDITMGSEDILMGDEEILMGNE